MLLFQGTTSFSSLFLLLSVALVLLQSTEVAAKAKRAGPDLPGHSIEIDPDTLPRRSAGAGQDFAFELFTREQWEEQVIEMMEGQGITLFTTSKQRAQTKRVQAYIAALSDRYARDLSIVVVDEFNYPEQLKTAIADVTGDTRLPILCIITESIGDVEDIKRAYENGELERKLEKSYDGHVADLALSRKRTGAHRNDNGLDHPDIPNLDFERRTRAGDYEELWGDIEDQL